MTVRWLGSHATTLQGPSCISPAAGVELVEKFRGSILAGTVPTEYSLRGGGLTDSLRLAPSQRHFKELDVLAIL